jgi:hypothetical protein
VVRLPRLVDVTRIEVQYTWPAGQLEVFGVAPLRPDGYVENIPLRAKLRPLYEDARWRVYENTAALPRAFLVTSAAIARQDQDVMAWMDDEAFDPRRMAILERGDATTAIGAEAPWPGWQLVQDAPPGEARVERYGTEEIVVRTVAATDGFLVLLDPYYPGWVATVDWQPAEIYRADYLFRGLFVPAGEHTVRFSYQPVPFRIGAALGAATIVLLAAVFAGVLASWLVGRARGWVRPRWRRPAWVGGLVPALPRRLVRRHPRGRVHATE